MSFTCRETLYSGAKCLELKSSYYSITISLDYGIRILCFRRNNGENILGEDIPIELDVENDKWKMYGGHRLWLSPETFPCTYSPDNEPVLYEIFESGVEITQKDSIKTSFGKRISIKFTRDGSEVLLKHVISNKGYESLEAAAWALTVMRKGGRAIVPLSRRNERFLSTRHFEVWPYTDLNDVRFDLSKNFFSLTQSEGVKEAFKLGINNEDGWAAYEYEDEVFIKKFNHLMGEDYPDNGCSFEIYTNEHILELESLSPLKRLDHNEEVVHCESWSIIDKKAFEKKYCKD